MIIINTKVCAAEKNVIKSSHFTKSVKPMDLDSTMHSSLFYAQA